MVRDNKKSSLDVPEIKVNITCQEIVEAVCESRAR
jgi:hypothetical protein